MPLSFMRNSARCYGNQNADINNSRLRRKHANDSSSVVKGVAIEPLVYISHA